MASGDTLAVFTALHNSPPAASFMTFDTRNSIPILVTSDSADTNAVFSGVLPRRYSGGGLTVTVHILHTGTTGASRWLAAIERCNTDLDADSFAAAQGASCTPSGTSGIPTTAVITFTSGAQMDSLAAGEPYRLQVTRDGDGTTGTDDATGAQLAWVEVRET